MGVLVTRSPMELRVQRNCAVVAGEEGLFLQ